MKLIINKTHSIIKNEGKILGLLADMAMKQDHIVEDLHNVKSEIGKINAALDKVNTEIVKLSLQTSENTRDIFKLSDKVEQMVDHENRILKLERIVFK